MTDEEFEDGDGYWIGEPVYAKPWWTPDLYTGTNHEVTDLRPYDQDGDRKTKAARRIGFGAGDEPAPKHEPIDRPVGFGKS